MKIFNLLFITIFIINTSLPQIKVDYDIYISFSTSNNELYVKDYKFDKYNLKNFIITKKEERILPKQELYIDKNGKLKKSSMPANPYHSCCNWGFTYDSSIHVKKKILKVKIVNKITYKDFLNSSTESFNKIIKNANKVYIIDTSEENDSIYYTAYEVSSK
jgi:hypothetical protein